MMLSHVALFGLWRKEIRPGGCCYLEWTYHSLRKIFGIEQRLRDSFATLVRVGIKDVKEMVERQGGINRSLSLLDLLNLAAPPLGARSRKDCATLAGIPAAIHAAPGSDCARVFLPFWRSLSIRN